MMPLMDFLEEAGKFVQSIKSAQETALRVAELAYQAGVPVGVFNVLPGGGKEVGEPIGRHHDVSMVSFTGSTDTDRRFLHYAAESNLKRIVLECGGKKPPIGYANNRREAVEVGMVNYLWLTFTLIDSVRAKIVASTVNAPSRTSWSTPTTRLCGRPLFALYVADGIISI